MTYNHNNHNIKFIYLPIELCRDVPSKKYIRTGKNAV